MDELFPRAKNQYIDDNGKLRGIKLIHLDTWVMIITSPALSLPIPIENTLKSTNLDVAMNLIKEYNLKIIEQSEHGLWLSDENNDLIYSIFIPIENMPKLKNINFTVRLNPLTQCGKSDLSQHLLNKKIASILQEYVLYTYSLDPINFGDKSFSIKNNVKYKIENLNKRLYKDGNNIIYDSQGRIIVPDIATRDRLISFIKLVKINNPQLLEIASTKTTLDSYYESIIDFKKRENTLLFADKKSIHRWIEEKNRGNSLHLLQFDIDENTIDPYVYSNSNIQRGAPVIVQNVENNNLYAAMAVSYYWSLNKINIGYRPNFKEEIKNIPYQIFTTRGPGQVYNNKKREHVSVFVLRYSKDVYAAMLFL